MPVRVCMHTQKFKGLECTFYAFSTVLNGSLLTITLLSPQLTKALQGACIHELVRGLPLKQACIHEAEPTRLFSGNIVISLALHDGYKKTKLLSHVLGPPVLRSPTPSGLATLHRPYPFIVNLETFQFKRFLPKHSAVPPQT